MKKPLLLISSFIILIIFSCKKDSFITSSDASVSFSVDTVHFDTVFVATGSVTQSVKIINNNDQKILLKDVKLMGGSNSVFKINIDGNSTPDASNIEVAANDSIYVFVSVLINPNNNNLPFVLQDSILVSYNGNQKFIQLQAYGQNAHFLNNEEIKSNTVWANDLPYVILGGLQIDSGYSLTIQKGCRIYFHANAPLLVDGTLNVQGNDTARVYFAGDRLDEPYKNFPASWPGIYFRESSIDNVLQFAVIKNAYQGVVAENLSTDANPKVALNDCIIDNVYDAGILGAQTSITAQNCLISNCGKDIVFGYGGSYSFTNCTAVSYPNNYIADTFPILNVSNYTSTSSGILTADLNANFINCIFWGTSGTDDKVVVFKQGNNTFNVNFSNCLWKVKNIPANITSSNMLSVDPMFDSVNNQIPFYDFHLKSGSPAVDYGVSTTFTFDLDGNPRGSGIGTDLGCYERQQ
ncbi:MAG TPA: choice-of-anchor Q domain-containing protein [Puia sp.]|nr:choice-of-anchor Q domain-containing protein [Puia sp.]